jgi:hypothetical protein
MKFISILVVVVVGLVAGEAWAATTVATDYSTVHNACGDWKLDCTKACGSTTCNYHCDSDGSNCTVTIYRPASGGGRRGAPSTGNVH